MSNTSHTPGPWEVHKMDNGYGYQIISHNPRVYVMGSIAANGAGINGKAGKAKANARLIAAAPELLEACETLKLWFVREKQGPQYPAGTTRDTPGNEVIWRDWWEEQLTLCKRAEETAASAIAKATGQLAMAV